MPDPSYYSSKTKNQIRSYRKRHAPYIERNRQILKELKKGKSLRAVAKEFNLNVMTIRRVKHRHDTWGVI